MGVVVRCESDVFEKIKNKLVCSTTQLNKLELYQSNTIKTFKKSDINREKGEAVSIYVLQ